MQHDCVGQKRMEGPSLVRHEKVPQSFGLRSGDRGNKADGVGNHRRHAQLSTGYWEEHGGVSHRLLGGFLLKCGACDWHALRLA